MKTDDGVRQFGQKHQLLPAGVRSREATPKQQSRGDSKATGNAMRKTEETNDHTANALENAFAYVRFTIYEVNYNFETG